MGEVFYTSDTHFNHIKVARTRGFSTVEDHDNWVIETWNHLVSPDDIVWHLGDVGLGSATRVLEIVGSLNGTKHLITGNHDQVFPGNRDAFRHQHKWLKVFDSVQPFARRKVQGHQFMLSHFPYIGDHTPEDRYVEYRLRYNAAMPIVHGHTHSHLAFDPLLAALSAVQLHVGWDAFCQPVPQDIVVEALASIVVEALASEESEWRRQ